MGSPEQKPTRPWKKIAEEASKEKDNDRLLKLTRELGDALERERESQAKEKKAAS